MTEVAVVIRHAQGEMDRNFDRLQVADVEHKHVRLAVEECDVELFPGVDQVDRIDPFVRTRWTNIVGVIVKARTTGSCLFLLGWNTAYEAVVVIGPE